MNISDIRKTLTGEISLEYLYKMTEGDVSNYKKALEKKGSVVPIVVDGKLNIRLTLDAAFLIKLLEFLKSDKKTLWFVAYLSDAFSLIEGLDFASNEVMEFYEALSDTEYVNSLSSDRIDKLIKELKSI